uniref:Uncharacterized protein n=1 Tax=Anguilla anguilla TaxID=7936 RepID=A0A0E9V567_ANGAN
MAPGPCAWLVGLSVAFFLFQKIFLV